MATIPAGRINRLFGTDGGVMLSLYPAFPDDFDPEQTPLLVTIDALEVPLWCDRFERRGISGAVAAFADMDTQRRAQELLGLEFRIDATAQEEDADGEFYLEDLIGFTVEAEEIGAEAIATEAGEKDTGKTVADRSAETDSPAPAHRIRYGRLTDYYDSDANPLFEVEIDGRQVLIPAVEEFIARIDFKGRTLKMVLPEGLLELE